MGTNFAIFILCSILSSVLADEFLVLRSPKAIEFKGDSALTADAVEDVIVASLGYSISTYDDESYFYGLVINDPFNVAKGVVAISVEGAGNLNLDDAKSFKINGYKDGLSAALKSLQQRQASVVDLDLKTDVTSKLETSFGTITPKENRSVNFMKPKQNKPDQDLLDQLAIVDGLTSLLLDVHTELPIAAAVRVNLNAFAKIHNADTSAYAEGLKLLKNSITELAEASEKAYDGKALVVVINTAEAHARAKRQAASPAASAKELNIVEGRDPNFPVFFNIFFWFMFAFFFTLLAVSLAIGTMDPGRDSIIYRMTSTRMKKEN